MTTLSDHIDRFQTDERTVGNSMLEPAEIAAQAIAAALHYSAYGPLAMGVANPATITLGTEVDNSAWSVIRPLFLLYVEREESRITTASRIMGEELAYGRELSEIAQDIDRMESPESVGGVPAKAFYEPIVSV